MNDNTTRPDPVKTDWGKIPEDHFGYGSDEERRRRRGLEDWELLASMEQPASKRVPRWFLFILAGALIVAFFLTLPFWGDRPDHPRPWFTWGHLLAVVYFGAFGYFVYWAVNKYTGADEDEGEGRDEEKP